MLSQIPALTAAMIEYDKGDVMRIHHFLKVHAFARLIGLGENLSENTQFILEAAALVHDIGIHKAEALHGSSAGKFQEQEGPAEARTLLQRLDFPADVIERVAFLVGHHHTYSDIDGVDYQILVEADFLVNLYEDETPFVGRMAVRDNIFKTKTGLLLWEQLYG